MSGGSQIFFGAATPACWTVRGVAEGLPAALSALSLRTRTTDIKIFN